MWSHALHAWSIQLWYFNTMCISRSHVAIDVSLACDVMRSARSGLWCGMHDVDAHGWYPCEKPYEVILLCFISPDIWQFGFWWQTYSMRVPGTLIDMANIKWFVFIYTKDTPSTSKQSQQLGVKMTLNAPTSWCMHIELNSIHPVLVKADWLTLLTDVTAGHLAGLWKRLTVQLSNSQPFQRTGNIKDWTNQ